MCEGYVENMNGREGAWARMRMRGGGARKRVEARVRARASVRMSTKVWKTGVRG